ncbi:S41 family peptidase [Flavobacterium crassostreae]|uniref:Peptidase S41 n=1 Tax=Flavobacterium crassostreae TaxID=1763534 RepID=A0A1B9E7F2_9FLAO|nr:S41 family peptidase [Flavobacterium crassostreae]OCB77872.1 peptidase S41 [Flavobacterium crassostreae]
MRTTLVFALVVFCCSSLFLSCQDMDDVPTTDNLVVQDFVWKGLNLYYLWQPEVVNLADKRFVNQQDLNHFLTGFSAPKDVFNALLMDKSIDRFSWIVDDYLALEGTLEGTTKNNGLKYALAYKPGSTQELIGYVRYVIPNSSAAANKVQRGMLFYGIDGSQLTLSNYRSLLAKENYSINLATYQNGIIIPGTESIALTKTVLSEDPIFIHKIISKADHQIAYVMYNGFYSAYDTALNEIFATFKNQKITDFVLDLRYNAGGSINTATRLASMLTGQYTGKIFAKQQWNPKINSYFESNNPRALQNNFTDKIDNQAIHSLNLNQIYILTSKNTASASELIINGLKPYLNVIQIGDVTTGKNVGSVTLYDSPTFGKKNRNPKHRYAMQPIVLKMVNATGQGNYTKGIEPDFLLLEKVSNLGVLGTDTEPLLGAAIAKITGVNPMAKHLIVEPTLVPFYENKTPPEPNTMYLEEAPEGILKALD